MTSHQSPCNCCIPMSTWYCPRSYCEPLEAVPSIISKLTSTEHSLCLHLALMQEQHDDSGSTLDIAAHGLASQGTPTHS